MTTKDRNALVAELQGALAVHDTAAVDAIRAARRHIRARVRIERELQRLEPRKRADARIAFA